MRIGMDVDGVLANWDRGFRVKLIQASGRRLCPPEFEPPVWNWPQHYGYTDDEITSAYHLQALDPFFWEELKPMPGAHDFMEKTWRLFGNVNVLIRNGRLPDTMDVFSPEIYFITSRRGPAVKEQTHTWLQENGWTPANTSVLINRHGDKGDVCKALGVNVFVDDRPENCVDVYRKCPGARIFLIDRAHNRGVQQGLKQMGIDTISLDRFTRFVIDSYAHTEGLPEGHLYAAK